MISCGEPSGDLYAGALTREIKALDPSARITGFGGDRLREAGASLVSDFSGLSVTGLLEVARTLPRTYAAYRRMIADATESRPDVFVAVEGFRDAAAGEAFDSCDVVPLCPESRDQAAVIRNAIEPDRTSAAMANEARISENSDGGVTCTGVDRRSAPSSTTVRKSTGSVTASRVAVIFAP